ncbi:uncharacterized protein LOC129714357 [Leucoraja erinacea]|uniref:uncharacterized protein LOC129714357 n=1 Tax=Leucoraja erinaceus TaxID=7782 RepID=UPI0024540B00|nr:uncharacterized protein LOC129714357 [Leucoraja erinacea]
MPGPLGYSGTLCLIFLLQVLLSSPLTPWKILPVVKYFVLYYFEGPEECWQSFPQHNTFGLYQTVFLSQQAAAFHCQRLVGNPFSGTNLHTVMLELDADIGKSFLKEEILSTYRLVALKCLIIQRYDIVPACWRMLHSLAAQLEGLNRLNEMLQELLSVEKVSVVKSSMPPPGKILDEALLMYQQVLQATLDRERCPVPAGFLEVALSKIQVAVGGRANVDQLQDVAVMCRAVADVVSWEIHALCPEVESLLQTLDKSGSVLQAPTTAPHALGPDAAAVVSTRHCTGTESPPLIYSSREALDSW